jgi:hypothetical protein
MLISHKESSKTQTNSILNSYYKDTYADYEGLKGNNEKLVGYQKNVAKGISQIETALANYFKAAKYLYMLEQKLADVLHISIDWSQLDFANTYQEVLDYDLNN